MRYLYPNDHLLFDSKAVKQPCAECERVAAPPEPSHTERIKTGELIAKECGTDVPTWPAGFDLIDKLRRQLSTLEQALRTIGNVIGGPTMTYAPNIERKELLERVKKVSDLVVTALSGESRQ